MAQLHGSVSAGGGGRGWGAGWPAAPTGGSGGQGSVWVCKGGSPGQEGATLGAVAPLGAGREAACGGQRAGSPGGWTVLAPGVVVCARTTITPLRPWELRPGSGLSLRGVEPGQQFLPPSRGEGLGRPGPQGTWLRQVEPCGGEPADRRRSQATEAQSSGSARFAHGPPRLGASTERAPLCAHRPWARHGLGTRCQVRSRGIKKGRSHLGEAAASFQVPFSFWQARRASQGPLSLPGPGRGGQR